MSESQSSGEIVDISTAIAQQNAAEEAAFAERVRAAMGVDAEDSYSMKLFRKGDGKELIWLNTVSPDDVVGEPEIYMKTHHGGGRFVLMLIGRKGVLMRHNVTISGPPKITQSESQAPQESSATLKILESIAQSQTALMQLLSRPAPAPPPPPTLMEQIQLLTALQTLTKPAASQGGNSITELAANVRALKELSGELGGGGEKDTSDVLMGALPGLLDLIQTGMKQRQEQQTLPAVVVPQSAQPAPALQQPTQQASDMEALAFQGVIQKLVMMATQNAPALEGAEFLYEVLPNEVLPMLKLPNWFDILALQAPQLVPHRAWLETVKPELDRLFAQPE
jgi:hypothetical protein